jgi:hypothetical protein
MAPHNRRPIIIILSILASHFPTESFRVFHDTCEIGVPACRHLLGSYPRPQRTRPLRSAPGCYCYAKPLSSSSGKEQLVSWEVKTRKPGLMLPRLSCSVSFNKRVVGDRVLCGARSKLSSLLPPAIRTGWCWPASSSARSDIRPGRPASASHPARLH